MGTNTKMGTIYW